jgi:hypothetical protein
VSPIPVFVSVGRTSTPEQEQFVTAIESHMLGHGLTPQTLGRNYWSSQDPLKAIDELIGLCAGVAIVGFERLHVVQGVDRRGSDKEQQVSNLSLPTVWNQIEAAMAYARRLPLLVLVQKGLRNEGLLEPGYDWYVKQISLDATLVADAEFCGIFGDWRERVEKYHGEHQRSPREASETGSSPSKEARADLPIALGRQDLRQILAAQFSEDELMSLCFDLDVDFDDLKGATKTATVVSLIKFFERRDRLDALVDGVRRLRPLATRKAAALSTSAGHEASGVARVALYRALLSAFPQEGELERMLDLGMGIRLAEIASGNLSNRVHAVVTFAEARGLTSALVRAALTANPENPELRALAESGLSEG